jgi:hypothetical protein
LSRGDAIASIDERADTERLSRAMHHDGLAAAIVEALRERWQEPSIPFVDPHHPYRPVRRDVITRSVEG